MIGALLHCNRILTDVVLYCNQCPCLILFWPLPHCIVITTSAALYCGLVLCCRDSDM